MNNSSSEGTSIWQEFHDNHAHEYMSRWYVQNWKKEVDFVLEELNLEAGNHILDVGCGAGRHAVELAKRGYHVTGIDFSAGMLDEARKAAQEAEVEVEWTLCDATQFQPSRKFDGVICMLEAAFALVDIGEDPLEHDLAILRNINTALKSRGRLILEAPNALNSLRGMTQDDIENGKLDPITMVAHCPCSWQTPEGEPKELMARLRSYFPCEIPLLFRQSNFEVESISGSSCGLEQIKLDGPTITIVAQKLGEAG
jgi:SAM-dependent methyltransferase